MIDWQPNRLRTRLGDLVMPVVIALVLIISLTASLLAGPMFIAAAQQLAALTR